MLFQRFVSIVALLVCAVYFSIKWEHYVIGVFDLSVLSVFVKNYQFAGRLCHFLVELTTLRPGRSRSLV